MSRVLRNIQTCHNLQIWMSEPFPVTVPAPSLMPFTDLLLEGQQPAEVVVGQSGDEVSSIYYQQWRTLWSGHRSLPIQQLQDVHSGCKQPI